MQIKETIKKVIGDKNVQRYYYGTKISKINNENKIKSFFKVRNYRKYTKLAESIEFKTIDSKYFYYYIDTNKTLYHNGQIIGNLMLDYSKILNHSFDYYSKEVKKISNAKLLENEKDFLACIGVLISNEQKVIDDEEIKQSLNGLLNRKANSFRDALQRILFLNQVQWQTGIFLNGLGRLDLILDKFYKSDLKENKITRQLAKEYLKEFLILLHKDYYFKSNSLFGDTGQIIILGGLDKKGTFFCNDLTFIIIELIQELDEPDPKVLLRVAKNTPKDLMRVALECIMTGVGCPLLANDDVIISKLISFGYAENDAYNYGTSACWEPYIPGKSFDQNNLGTINFMEPLKIMLKNTHASNMEEFLSDYFNCLNSYLNGFKTRMDSKEFASDALLTLFNNDCIKNNKDISEGGAVYTNYGFTSVGLPNLINSIFSVDELVFKSQKLCLEDFIRIINADYEGNALLIKEIKNIDYKFGVDDDRIVELTNCIIREVSNFFENKKNKFGGKYKFGLSSPSYITDSVDYPASFDGRKNGEPFSVHISNDSANGYTELINFASQLDYTENRFNGNVIDYFVTPNFIRDNFEKFVDFLMISIKKGFFEMQMNVVSSKQLIEARKNPEKFPNLIVRVWGFSAYFKDLPDEYKDYIIERALKHEGNC